MGGADDRYRHDPHYRTGAAALAEVAGPDAERVAATAGLAMLTPACLAAGRLADGLRMLAEEGLVPVFLRRVVFTEEQVRGIWRFHEHSRSERWDVAVRLFSAGPAVVAMVAGGAPAATRLHELKGPSDPLEQEERHLRHRLGAPNKINNLLHTADSVPAVVREAALMLPHDALRAAWTAVRDRTPAPDVEAFAWSNASAVRSDGVSLAHAVARLRWRAYDAGRRLAADPERPGLRESLAAQLDWADRVPATDAQAALRLWRERFADDPSAGAFADWLGDAPSGEAQALDRAMQSVDDVLAERPVDLVALEADLHAAGIGADEWELLVLATEVVTQDVRRAEAEAVA